MRSKACVLLSFAVVALMAAACVRHDKMDHSTRRLLNELDGYVAAREVYVARKLDQMEALHKLCRTTEDPERRFDLEMTMAGEYFAFSFDSTQACLKRGQELALV